MGRFLDFDKYNLGSGLATIATRSQETWVQTNARDGIKCVAINVIDVRPVVDHSDIDMMTDSFSSYPSLYLMPPHSDDKRNHVSF